MKDRVVKTYFGWTATAIRGSYPPSFPWRFELERDGHQIQFSGVPNQCGTARQALRRAWWRAKWLAEGTYDDHYK